MTFEVINADCIDAMRAMPESSVDAIVTDPPYGLEFMGKDWDRDEGLDGFAKKVNADWPQNLDGNDARGASPRANNHPTVKPTDLMRYLCRLVTPPGGLILDPFTGSGSTGTAAVLEGFRFIGAEKEAEYLEIARARILHAAGGDLA